jgi:hypothetical protein
MESLKKHGDPLEEEIRPETVRGAEQVGNNQPGSKGDGSIARPGSGSPAEEEGNPGEFVRSANQNPARPSDDATMEPGGDLGHKRTMM